MNDYSSVTAKHDRTSTNKTNSPSSTDTQKICKFIHKPVGFTQSYLNTSQKDMTVHAVLVISSEI